MSDFLLEVRNLACERDHRLLFSGLSFGLSTGEVLQVRRANIVGAQGHSGHGNFPRVIQAMASGMNMLPMITKTITLDDVPENIVMLRTNRQECKITCIMD